MDVRFHRASATDRAAIARALGDAELQARYASRGSSPQGMRQDTDAVTAHALVRQCPPEVRVEPVTLAGLPCEWLIPPGADGPQVLVYLHGGGFVRGNLALGRANAAVVARASGLKVLAVGYRQAPEHPFPAAPDDLAAAYAALLAHNGLRADQVAVMGESSGGTLALGLAVRHAGQPGMMPAGIAALSPMADLRLCGASWHYNAPHDVADRATGQRMVALYLAGASAEDPLVSPALHHFKGACPLWVGIGSLEAMLSDTEFLARKADDAGTPVQLEVFEAMPHGFTRFDMPLGTAALEAAAHWCRDAVRRS